MAKTVRAISVRFLKKYEKQIQDYAQATKVAEELVRDILRQEQVHIHVVTSRYKGLDSLRLKLWRKKYRQPGKQLTDKIGVRVITYFESDIRPCVEKLERELEIDARRSEDKRTKLSLREFGYLSVHLVARTKGAWSRSSKYRPLRGKWFEIQVRSILEHAWAEIEHEVVYKSGIVFPDETKRRFARLAGTLEILETEFVALRTEKWHLVDSYLSALNAGRKLSSDILDSAKMIAVLEIERPNAQGWRTASGAAGFPPGIEALCAAALTSAGIKSSNKFRKLLRSPKIRAAEKAFTALSLQTPTHLASTLITVATQSAVIFKDYFPDMVSNPAIAPLLQR